MKMKMKWSSRKTTTNIHIYINTYYFGSINKSKKEVPLDTF